MKEYIVTQISEYDGAVDIWVFDEGDNIGENYIKALACYEEKILKKGYKTFISEVLIKKV